MKQRVLLHIDNTYTCGRESSSIVWVAAPSGDLSSGSDDMEDWWQDVVWDETGDGHAALGHRCESYYAVRIVAVEGLAPAQVELLAGRTHEWY